MNLKDFVSQSLVQIVEGVVAASEPISSMGGSVSPSFSARREETIGHTNDGSNRPVQGVQFDVAIVASTEASMEAGGGLRVAGLSLGGKGADKDSQEVTSRLSFTVPLALPVDPKSADAAKAKAQQAEQKVQAARNQGSGGFGSTGWMARG